MATRVGVRVPARKKQRAEAVEAPAPADIPELVRAPKAEKPKEEPVQAEPAPAKKQKPKKA